MYLCCNPPYEGGEKEDSGGDAILNPININELELELATPTVLAQFTHCRSAETESIDMDIDYILITRWRSTPRTRMRRGWKVSSNLSGSHSWM